MKYHLIGNQVLVEKKDVATAYVSLHKDWSILFVKLKCDHMVRADFATPAEATEALQLLESKVNNRQQWIYQQLVPVLASLAITTYTLWLPLVFK